MVSTDMRLAMAAATVVMLTAACAHPGGSTRVSPDALSPVRVGRINPANIKRVAGELPSGYEVTGLSAATGPIAIWGLGENWTAHPARCATLADPVHGSSKSGKGLSASGSGGIVYAAVAPAPANVDAAVMSQCRQWTMATRQAATRVHLVEPPRIDGIQTVGMASETTTSVEGGSEIASRAEMFAAYLGDYYVFTALITDPGSVHSRLPPRFAADLLVKTVSALRG